MLDYLAGGGASLRQQYADVFGKIDLDDEGFQTRPGRVQREFLQNVGVIPETGVVQVRLKNRLLGSVEESFMRMLKIGDVFVISGRPVRLERTGQMEAFVTARGWRPAHHPALERRQDAAFRRGGGGDHALPRRGAGAAGTAKTARYWSSGSPRGSIAARRTRA